MPVGLGEPCFDKLEVLLLGCCAGTLLHVPGARVSCSGRASQSDAVTAGHQSIWVTWLSWSWTLDQLWNLVDVGLDLSDVNFLQAVTVRHFIYVRLSWKITGKCQRGMSPCRRGLGMASSPAEPVARRTTTSSAKAGTGKIGQGPVMGWASNK